MLTIAIQPDDQLLSSGRRQSFSNRWIELANAAGISAKLVNMYAADLYPQLLGCRGFMWWFAQPASISQAGKRVIPAIEHGMGIPTFPSWATIWHFDDKIAQKYLLDAAGIPTPRTWIFWTLEEALLFCRTAAFPMVMKLAGGIASQNVRLLSARAEAEFWVKKMFSDGLVRLQDLASPSYVHTVKGRVMKVGRALLGRSGIWSGSLLHRGYVLFQEFVPGNEFDTRITVIGDRAFGFRRFNRPGDFRASGSGRIDWDPLRIENEKVSFAFQAAKRLRAQSLAVDILRRPDGTLVMNEISYYYEGWAVASCPGHWSPDGKWRDISVAPEDAIFADFVRSATLTSA